MSTCKASCTDRLGRNPNEHGTCPPRRPARARSSPRTARSGHEPWESTAAFRTLRAARLGYQHPPGRQRTNGPSLSSLASSPSSRSMPYCSTGPRWSCRCLVRRHSHAPSPTHAEARPCGSLVCHPWNLRPDGLGRPVHACCKARTGSAGHPGPIPSRSDIPSGTHRAPPQQYSASTKQRPFPHRRLCSPPAQAYYGRLRRPPGRDPLPGCRLWTPRSGDTSAGHRAGEGLPSSRRHYLNVPRPYAGGSLTAALPGSSPRPWPSP